MVSASRNENSVSDLVGEERLLVEAIITRRRERNLSPLEEERAPPQQPLGLYAQLRVASVVAAGAATNRGIETWIEVRPGPQEA